MKLNIELQNLKDILSKMNVMNINQAYVGFNKKGVEVYLFPCEKAQLLITRKEIEKELSLVLQS
jgi:hypothetical protein